MDACAGALGSLGLASAEDPDRRRPDKHGHHEGRRHGDGERSAPHLAIVAGPSGTTLATAAAPVLASGPWGPIRDAILPGRWTIEGGQSHAGALLDHVVDLRSGLQGYDHARALARMGQWRAAAGANLAIRIGVLPDFTGNRSPLVDAGARGVVSGLTLDRSFDARCALYWRRAVALAPGMRRILEHTAGAGPTSGRLTIAGGLEPLQRPRGRISPGPGQ